MHYYLIVVDVMDKMFIKELYENRNLAVSRISGGLVWVRRTKEGKDIRVKRKEIGLIGEVHPEALLNFNITMPVVIAEMNVNTIMDFIKRRQ